jgi:hypothetical protein
MAIRNIKDAKDLSTNELIYFKSHAKATFMNNGSTVEDAIDGLNIKIDETTTAFDTLVNGNIKETIDNFNEVINFLEGINDSEKFVTKLQEIVNELNKKQETLVSGENIKTINGESLLGDGNIDVQNIINITYSELKSLRDNSQLVPCKQYRITDYITTTTEDNTRSAGHQFDIIVTANDVNTLSHLAKAVLHEGDTYFTSCNITRWQLWYDIDNNIELYKWADAENGKGVIYRMIDDRNNDCPYDFKNILFYTDRYDDDENTSSDNYYYTFSHILNNTLIDSSTSLSDLLCNNNVINYLIDYEILDPSNITQLKRRLNFNIFKCTDTYGMCCGNKLNNDCFQNIFSQHCIYNILDANCMYNTFNNEVMLNVLNYGCSYNMFNYGCNSNILRWNSNENTFGTHCSNNILNSNCSNNILDNDCSYNTFGNNCCDNVLANYCENNIFEEDCNNNKITTINNSDDECAIHWKHINFNNSCRYINLYYDCTDNNYGNIKNIILRNELSGYGNDTNICVNDLNNNGKLIIVTKSGNDIVSYYEDDIINKQDKLVSGENIATINGESLLNGNDIEIITVYKVIDHGTNDTTYTLTPNIFHKWDIVNTLNLTLGAEETGITNEYLFQFKSGSEGTSLSLPSNIVWINNEVPIIYPNCLYQVSIFNNLATICGGNL